MSSVAVFLWRVYKKEYVCVNAYTVCVSVIIVGGVIV
jgi:hypothetical protein